MTHTPGRRLAAFVLAALTVVAPACGSGADEAAPPPERAPSHAVTVSASTSPADAAVAAGRRFLDRHLRPDGRVARPDQGDDTVSEGQAYGMLVAAAIGDRPAFDTIWGWTRTHLRRDDGLLSWRWDGGRVVDEMSATDADLDAAHALTLAADRFDEPAYDAAARELASAITAHSVIEGRDGPVAMAGPWAAGGRWVNPSYGTPVAFDALAELTGDPLWDQVADGARRVVEGSTTSSDLPPDWAVLTDAAVDPRGAPDGGTPQHGYDGARTATRYAVDCDRRGRSLAAAMADEYRAAIRPDGHPPAILDLDGTPGTDHAHPVTTVGAAAAVLAAGDRDAALRLLDRAAALDARAPTYYGSAWVALGRLWLTTDRLGGCTP